jgi:hypothetical protein
MVNNSIAHSGGLRTEESTPLERPDRLSPHCPMYSIHEGTRHTTESAIRFFASSHQLSQLAPRTRILCVLFLLGILSQAISGILMHHHGAGWTPTSISLYYRGSEAPATANHAAFGIDTPDNPSAAPTPTGRIAIARSYGTLRSRSFALGRHAAHSFYCGPFIFHDTVWQTTLGRRFVLWQFCRSGRRYSDAVCTALWFERICSG